MARRAVLVAVGCALITAHGAAAQTPPDANPYFTRFGFSPAYVVATNPFSVGEAAAAGRNVAAIPSLTVEVGRQTDGSSEWHHLYGFPAYGFGVSFASAGSGSSRPVDAYTFFSWPFARPSDRVQITSDFGMGLSWNWKTFNQQTNSYAQVLGSDLNVRIDWGFYLRYLMTPQTSLYAGADFTHRSNGGMRQPDQGINVIGPSIGVRYNLSPEHARRRIVDKSSFRPAWEFIVGGSGGRKNVLDEVNYLQHNFTTANITSAVQLQFYRYGKVAAGTDISYDGSADARGDAEDADMVYRGTIADRLALGFYGGYEHVIGRFGALVQVGYKPVRGTDRPGAARLYERYGWRYHFNDHVWGTFAVR